MSNIIIIINEKINVAFSRRTARTPNGTVHGGIAILINNAIPHSHIQLNTSLQAIAVRATCHKTISVCCIYLSLSSKFNSNKFDNLIAQLPPPPYCLGTLMPTVPYGVALKLIFEER